MTLINKYCETHRLLTFWDDYFAPKRLNYEVIDNALKECDYKLFATRQDAVVACLGAKTEDFGGMMDTTVVVHYLFARNIFTAVRLVHSLMWGVPKGIPILLGGLVPSAVAEYFIRYEGQKFVTKVVKI